VSIGLAGHLGSWDLDAAVTSNLPAPSPLSLPSSVYADPDQGTWVSLTLAYRFSD